MPVSCRWQQPAPGPRVAERLKRRSAASAPLWTEDDHEQARAITDIDHALEWFLGEAWLVLSSENEVAITNTGGAFRARYRGAKPASAGKKSVAQKRVWHMLRTSILNQNDLAFSREKTGPF